MTSKENSQVMQQNFKPWEECEEMSQISNKIFNSGVFPMVSPVKTKFYITTNIKDVATKKHKVSIVRGILSVYLGEVAYTVEIDRTHWEGLSIADKYLLMSRLLLSCAVDENNKPRIMKPDVQEFSELVVDNYIDLKKVTDLIK